jgi:hypothetical protein
MKLPGSNKTKRLRKKRLKAVIERHNISLWKQLVIAGAKSYAAAAELRIAIDYCRESKMAQARKL